MSANSTLVAPAVKVEDWRAVAEQSTRWADEATRLANQMHPHLSATESVEQSKIAASLALSAAEANGAKATRLKHAAADAAQKAAQLAKVVVNELSHREEPKYRAQAKAWSRSQVIADQLTFLATTAASA